MQVLLGTSGAWYLRQTAKALLHRGALGELWISDKNSTNLPPEKFRRCWPFHLAMKPFYHCVPQLWTEKAFYSLSGIWRQWLRSQFNGKGPKFDVVHAIMGFATEFFDEADQTGALKVIDCPNSHPVSYYGYWQRECDLWCPGEKVPIPQWMFARMNRELERADMILCPSNFVRDTMVLNGISAAKCFINPFGTDTTVFQPRKTVPNKPRFVCVGTICVRKGHQYLFRAFDEVKKAVPEAELICVGDFKTDFRLEKSKWEGTFTHYPNLNHSELAQLLTTCSAFIFPSLEEGFARVISETMAAGLPIIASYESGATTLVRDGIEGFIIRPRDPQHIAEAMIKLSRDQELNRKMGEASHSRGAIKNSWQDYGDRLLLEYTNLLNKPKSNFHALHEQ